MLLFASGPTREYRFLRGLLMRDDNVVAHVLLQSARGPISQGATIKVLKKFPTTAEEVRHCLLGDASLHSCPSELNVHVLVGRLLECRSLTLLQVGDLDVQRAGHLVDLPLHQSHHVFATGLRFEIGDSSLELVALLDQGRTVCGGSLEGLDCLRRFGENRFEGPAGVGKTTVVSRSLESVSPARMVARIGRIGLAPDEVLELLLAGFGVNSKTRPQNAKLPRYQNCEITP